MIPTADCSCGGIGHDRGEELPELERVGVERDVADLDRRPRPEDRLDVGALAERSGQR